MIQRQLIPLLLSMIFIIIGDARSLAFDLGGFIEKAENLRESTVERSEEVVGTFAEEVLPPKLANKLKDLEKNLNPKHLSQLVNQHILKAQGKVLSHIHDPVLKEKADLLIHDLKFLYKKSDELLKGQCGQKIFTKEIPKWFKSQILNVEEVVKLGGKAAKVGREFLAHAPILLKFARTLADMNVKVGLHVLDPKNAQIIEQTSEHIVQIVQKLHDIPEIIESSIVVIKDIGLLVTEGTSCAETTVTEIEEVIEAIVEALSGVASCVETEGIGCLADVVAVKSVLVTAADSLGEIASCLATVATTAIEGAEDVIELVKLLYAFTDLINSVIALKDDISQIFDLISQLSDDVKEDIPDLQSELKEISQVLDHANHQVRGMLPEVKKFFFGLLAEFKGNINQLLNCSAEVTYIGLLVGYIGKDAMESVMDGITHLIHADKAEKQLKEVFHQLQSKAKGIIRREIHKMIHKIKKIRETPTEAIHQINHLIKSAGLIPQQVTQDVIHEAQDTIHTLSNKINHHRGHAKISLENKDFGGIKRVKKPQYPQIQGLDVDHYLNQAHECMKKLVPMTKNRILSK